MAPPFPVNRIHRLTEVRYYESGKLGVQTLKKLLVNMKVWYIDEFTYSIYMCVIYAYFESTILTCCSWKPIISAREDFRWPQWNVAPASMSGRQLAEEGEIERLNRLYTYGIDLLVPH